MSIVVRIRIAPLLNWATCVLTVTESMKWNKKHNNNNDDDDDDKHFLVFEMRSDDNFLYLHSFTIKKKQLFIACLQYAQTYTNRV